MKTHLRNEDIRHASVRLHTNLYDEDEKKVAETQSAVGMAVGMDLEVCRQHSERESEE